MEVDAILLVKVVDPQFRTLSAAGMPGIPIKNIKECYDLPD